MNVLITGGNGQLGCALRLASSSSALTFPCRFFFSDIADAPEESLAMLRRLGGDDVDLTSLPLDITDREAICETLRRYGIDAIVNCAGFTRVDDAESREELAERLNAGAVEELALAMKERNGLLVQISTDYVFGGAGNDAPIREDEPPAPTGAYGRTKFHGEQAVTRSGCRSIILRTAWLYSEFGTNFVRTMLRLTAARPYVNVVSDQVGTPTYAGDLAGAIFALLEYCGRHPEAGGIFHYSNEGACSWYEFAREIARLAGHRDCEIRPCRSEEYPSPVRRPAYSVLDKTSIREQLGLSIPHWTDSLRKCLKNIL